MGTVHYIVALKHLHCLKRSEKSCRTTNHYWPEGTHTLFPWYLRGEGNNEDIGVQTRGTMKREILTKARINEPLLLFMFLIMILFTFCSDDFMLSHLIFFVISHIHDLDNN